MEYKTRRRKWKSNLYQLESCWSMKTTTLSNQQSCQEHIVLFMSETEQAKKCDWCKEKRNKKKMEIHEVYECAWHKLEIYITKMNDNGEIQRQ